MNTQNGQTAGQNCVLEAIALGKSLQEILYLTTLSIENELPVSFASVLLVNETRRQFFSGSSVFSALALIYCRCGKATKSAVNLRITRI